MPSLERRYFDSMIFLYVITNKPPERGMNSKAAMQAAEQGRFRLVTSMLTMIEVIKDQTGPHAPSPEVQKKIVDFFEHDYVLMVQASRDIMKQARELCWKYGSINLKGVDAVHLASAIHAQCTTLYTYDPVLLKTKEPNIRVEEPHVPMQLEML